jgi:hypothetical protein
VHLPTKNEKQNTESSFKNHFFTIPQENVFDFFVYFFQSCCECKRVSVSKICLRREEKTALGAYMIDLSEAFIQPSTLLQRGAIPTQYTDPRSSIM